MKFFTVDRFKCTRCGSCLAVCPIKILKLDFFEFDMNWLKAKEGNFKFLEDKAGWMDKAEFANKVKNGRIIAFSGWRFRDPSALDKHADTIREYFTPLDKYLENIEACINNARKGCDILVGVHIRLTDYQECLGGAYFFNVNTYVRVIEKVTELFPGKKTAFLICSDEKLDKDLFTGHDVFFAPSHAVESMYALSRCDYIIGNPSTFSGWAAFYGKVPLIHITSTDEKVSIDKFRIPTAWNGVEIELPDGGTFIL